MAHPPSSSPLGPRTKPTPPSPQSPHAHLSVPATSSAHPTAAPPVLAHPLRSHRPPHPPRPFHVMTFPSLPLACLLLLFARATAQCQIHLPVVSTGASPDPAPVEVIDPTETRRYHPRHPLSNSLRILGGLKPSLTDFDNIAVFLDTTPSGQITSRCAGSLISASWVITSAQCAINPGTIVLISGVSNTKGTERTVDQEITHPDYFLPSEVERNDLMLVHLDRPLFTPKPSPSPSDVPESDQPAETTIPNPDVRQEADTNPDDDDDDDDGDSDDPAANPTPPPPLYNVMRINNNTDFAQDSSAPRFLRVKGYGLRTRPNEGQETLTGNTRPLLFADLLTSKCDDRFGNDEKRRLCTKRDNSCGPCFGDTGAPLYDVDKSGKVSVLVGIVTFGLQGLADGEAESTCTSGARATIYTAVAPYIGWIRETVDEDLTEFFIPKEGITNTNLDPGKPGLSVAARTSIIVVASLALIGFIAFLLVTCTLRRLRNRRKRWVEGLHAEESFVKGDEKHAGIADPFEGIVDDHKTPRLSVNSLSRAAVKSATEFSARSIGTIRALLMHVEEEEMAMEPREPMDDAPQWLPDAWEKLFKAPSKKDLEHIHKVKTQRVVDDVLEGGDKSVEPSLDHVAFKNARDEANLEAAWRKLEIQTSLRNLSEASGSKDGQESAPGTVPSTRNNSSRFLSRTSSRGGTHGAFSSILAGNVGGASSGTGAGGATDGKPDTLLAAFASIDAESEQVAEETMIDQLALQALATSKRPKVLETLRRKFSGSALLSALSNKNTESEATSPRVKLTSRKAITAGPSGQGGGQHGSVGRASSGRTGTAQTISALANRSSKPVGGGTPGRTGSTGSVSGLSGDMDRHGSMHIDYFSEDYSFSSSSDEEQPGQPVFNLESASRRFTEDRPDGIGSQQSLRSFRKSKPQSFEKLESRWMDRPDEDEDNLNELPMTEIESIIAEGTLEDNILRHRSWNGGNRSIFTTLSSRGTRQRATDANSSTLENVDNESMVGNHSLDEISEQTMEARIDEELHMTSTGDGSETVTIARLESDVHPVIEQTAYKEENEQLEVRMEQDYDKEKDLARPVQDMTKVSFAEVKAMWNEKVRRASET